MSEKVNIWDGVFYTGKYIGGGTLSSDSDTVYTVTKLTRGHEYVVELIVPSDRFRCSTFVDDPTLVDVGTNIRSLYDSDSPSAGNSFSFIAGLNEKFLMCYVGHASAGANNVQLVIYDLSADEPDKSRELEYVSWKCFISGNQICYVTSDPVISYIVPVVTNSIYTVTMTEVGNRLRVAYSSVDPTTMTSDYDGVSVLDNSNFPVGHSFEYTATADGWLVIYVSNNGVTPKISIVTDGFGGDGSDSGTEEPDVPSRTSGYLIQSGGSLFTVTDGVLTAVKGSVNADLFRTYGVDNIPASDLLITLTDPVVLHWTDADEINPLVAVVQGVPPVQTVESPDYDMTHSSIVGIEKVLVDASDDVRFAISFDSGQTWYTHTGQAWGILSEADTGMSASIMSAITTEDWNSIATTGKFRFRLTIPSVDSCLNSLVVDYLN